MSNAAFSFWRTLSLDVAAVLLALALALLVRLNLIPPIKW